MNPPSGYFVSAPWRSSGKTMISIGMAAMAHHREIKTQTFKKGPDFIDPLWLGKASGRPCYNLDPHQQTTKEITSLFTRHAACAQLSLVEGTMGLHDGLQEDGSDSNASIAKLLALPVILVVDCRGMHRTVAAIINGIKQFDEDLSFAGIILNRVKTARHGNKISKAIDQYSDFTILGELPDTRDISIKEHNLGLRPTADVENSAAVVESIRNLLESRCDLGALFDTSKQSHPRTQPIPAPVAETKTPVIDSTPLKIGIAKDEAFHFYYQDDLDYFASAGVQLVELSPMHDVLPENLDGLLLGGGFPERHAQALSENKTFIDALHNSVKSGLPVHAECGGLMYMCSSLITQDEQSWPMVDLIKANVRMCVKPVGRGYMKLVSLQGDQEPFWAHEFHHSEIEFDYEPEYVYRVTRGHGIDGEHDGVKVYNVIASYAHFRQTEATPWIDMFLSRVRKHQTVSYHV